MNDQQFGNGPVMDVLPPGSAAASPSSRPVVTSSSPQMADPMMTAPIGGSPLNVPVQDMSSNANNDIPLGANPATYAAPSQSAMDAAGVSTTIQPVAMSDGMNAPARGAFADQSAAIQTPNPLISGDASQHSFAQGQAMFGQVGSHKRGRKLFLIVLLILAVLGGAGYFGYGYYKKQNDSAKAVDTPAPVATTKVTKDTTFSTKLGNFSLDNKYEWKVTEKDTTTEMGDVAAANKKQYGTVTFAINDTQNLVIDSNIGGRGGDCEPAAKDVAFAAGNTCSSYKLLSATKLSTKNIPLTKLAAGAKGVYLVKYQIRVPQDGDTTLTSVGIAVTGSKDDGSEQALELNKDQMGAYFAQTFIDVPEITYVFKVVDANSKPTQLSDVDLTKVSEVLKTFTLN